MQIIAYPIGVSCRDAKVFGYCGASMSIGKTLLNFSYLRGVQFGMMGAFTSWRHMRSNAPRMLHVICLRNPLQVADMIVQLIGILVINLRQVVGIWQKSERNKAMNQNVPHRPRAICQGNRSISVRIYSPFQSSGFATTPCGAKGPRANLSAFGDFVQCFVAPNRGVGFSSHALIPSSILGCVNV